MLSDAYPSLSDAYPTSIRRHLPPTVRYLTLSDAYPTPIRRLSDAYPTPIRRYPTPSDAYPTPIRHPSGAIRRPSDAHPTRSDAIKRFAVVAMPIQRSGRQMASFLKPHGQAICSGPHSWTPKPPEAPAGRPSDINGPGVCIARPRGAQCTPHRPLGYNTYKTDTGTSHSDQLLSQRWG